MATIRILLAEDSTLVRRLMAQQLSREPDLDVIAEASDGRQACELALALTPDVLVTDLDMPIMNGIEVMERLSAARPQTRVILLTAHESLLSLGRLNGAAECLSKNCTPQKLAATIRKAMTTRDDGAGVTAGHQSAIERTAYRAGLTDRERAVLENLVTTDLTAAQIAHSLSGKWSSSVSESAVKHTIERVMNKVGVEPRTRSALVKHVLGRSHSGQSPTE